MAKSDKFSQEQHLQVENIWEQFSNLAYEWRVLLYLFGKRQERVDLLHEVSPTVASLFSNLLFNSVVMGLRRLTDPHKQGSNKNLSLEILCEISKDTELSQIYKKIKQLRKPIQTYADKRLAHSDKVTLLGDDGPKIMRMNVTDLTEEIEKFLRLFYSVHLKTHLEPFPVMLIPDENDFLRILYLGKKREIELKEEYFKYGMNVDAGTWDHSKSLPSHEDEYPEYLKREWEDELYKFR